MRLVKEIPHSHYLIQVHEYNGKYLLKITLDNFERFLSMREDYATFMSFNTPE